MRERSEAKGKRTNFYPLVEVIKFMSVYTNYFSLSFSGMVVKAQELDNNEITILKCFYDGHRNEHRREKC